MNHRGFTLLEVIVAIFILTVGVGSAFILISQTLSAASLARENLIASYLTQEGIELVRNIRDGNWLEEVAWNSDLGVGGWEGDYDDIQNLTSWVEPGNFLNIDSNGFYSYSAGTPTIYKRKITIEQPDGSTLRVSVEVFWQEKGRPHSIKAMEELRDWK